MHLGRRLFVFIVAAALLAGCAPQLQERRGAITAPQLTAEAVVTADGAHLPLDVWPARRPRAVIVAVHGFNGYAADFAMPAPWFARHGVTVYAYDQRGFGRTEQRGVWAGDDVLVDDLKTVTALVRTRHEGLPVYLMGASMGGAVIMAALGEGLDADGAILVAPAIWGWQAMNPFYKATLWAAAHTVPSMTATGSGLDIWPSDNIDMLRAYSRDPLNIKETRMDAVYGLVTLMDDAHDAAGRLGTPVLYLYGANDQLIPAGPTARVMAAVSAPKRVVYYEKGWHMLLHDKQRERVYEDVLAWIRNHDAPLPSGEELRGEQVAARVR